LKGIRLKVDQRSSKGWQPWGALVPFLGFAFVAATVVSLTAVLQHVGLVDAEENPIGLTGFIAFLLLPFAALGLAVLTWVRFVERRPLRTIGLVGAHRVRTFLYGQLAGIGMVITIVGGIWMMGGFQFVSYGNAFSSPVSLGKIVILLVCFAFQSSAEELFFRGWMLSAITAKFGVFFAVLLSSLVFFVVHFDPRANWIFRANVFLFAVFACCWVIRTGNVWGVMAWHGGWNWLLAVGFELRVTALNAHLPALLIKLMPVGPDYLTGGIEGPEGSILCTLVLIGGIVYHLLRGARKRSERSNQVMKPTAPFGNESSLFATAPCRGLSLSR
jgi:membrane protease YdiL (CAAX protease family)